MWLLQDENIIRKPQPEMGGAASVDSADSSPEREQPDGRTTSARRISMGEAAQLRQTSACFTGAGSSACLLPPANALG